MLIIFLFSAATHSLVLLVLLVAVEIDSTVVTKVQLLLLLLLLPLKITSLSTEQVATSILEVELHEATAKLWLLSTEPF